MRIICHILIIIFFISHNTWGQDVGNTLSDTTDIAPKKKLKNLTNDTNTIDTSKQNTLSNIQEKDSKNDYQRQVKVLFDVGNFMLNFADNRKADYQLAADYHFKNSWYLAAEGGYAQGHINYDNLQYKTNSMFLRLGADKSLLQPISKRDLDIVFFGFRYGIGIGTRGSAYYVVPSQFGPTKEGYTDKQDFMIHWGEMTGGIRVELWQGIYAGWNFRAKFLLNGRAFNNNISPNYIAGYGSGEKSTSFGFNIYLGYAIRWNKQF
jgi:hypothetical protein